MSRLLSRVARLTAVLAAGAGLVAAGGGLQLPSLDLASGGSRPGAPGGALAARTTPVARADLVCPGPETIGVRGVEPVGTAPAPAVVRAATPPESAAAPGAERLPEAPTPSNAATPSNATTLSHEPMPSDATSLPDATSQRSVSTSAPGDGSGVTAQALPGRALRTTSAGAAGPVGTSVTEAAGVEVTATGGSAPGLVAGQTTLVPSGDLRGLSSAACTPPSDDTWLVAGGTEAGRRGRIVLVNPADNPVDVDVDVLGEAGAVPRSPGSSLAVPARSRTVLLLDALAPGVRSPVVHVATTGGAVAATLSDAWLTGTTPQGVDDAGPAAAPGRRVLVPAVLGGGPSSVRIASTGGSQAVAQVRLMGPKGVVEVPGGGVVRVPAAGTRSVDLGALPSSGYLVEVVSDVPVVAGALVRRSGPVAGELAWFPSTAPAGALVGAAGLGSGPGWWSALVLGAPGDPVQGELVTVSADGTARTRPVVVDAGTTATVPTADAVAAWVRPRPGTGDLYATRVTTRADPRGQLITGGALVPAVLERRLPAVLPDR